MKQLQEISALVLLVVLLGLAGALTGCASAPQTQTGKVPVPVECPEQVPSRPAMPTDALKVTTPLHQKARAAMAEIELREGYEGKLLAALQGCTKPIDAGAGGRRGR